MGALTAWHYLQVIKFRIMKGSILSFLFSLLAICSVTAQSTTTNAAKWEVKEGNVLTYGVKSGGKAYDFIVTVKSFDALGTDAIVFDWKMTAPVNKSGTIKITQEAANNSKAFYNWFGDGEKTLYGETSVFIGFMLSLEMTITPKDDVVKIKVDGASAAEEEFTMIDDNHQYSFTENGVTKTLKTLLLKNKSNGKTLTIYNEGTHPFIVAMNIGFEIALKSVK
jgi:hypothetical protein